MPLPETIRQRLTDEFHYAAKKIEEEEGLQRKLYFFSVTYGEASRLLNLAWDNDLALIHVVCQASHQQIEARVQMMMSGADRVMGLPKETPDVLARTVHSLALLFEKAEMDREQLAVVLAEVSALAYTSAGNGGYLYMKGVIKF